MRSPRPASGFTLISMLIGLVIGLLSIAAMLVLYQTLISTSHQVNAQARIDGQLATSSLASQQQLQQAGFGVASAAAGTDLIVLSDAALMGGKLSGTAVTSYAATVSGNAVIWGYNPTGASAASDPSAYVCEGLVITGNSATSSSDLDSTGLTWLAPVSCGNAAQWQSLTWQAHQLASTRSIGTASNFQLAPATCWPYGQTTAISSLQVSYYLKAQSTAAASGVASASTAASAQFDAIPVFSVCLPNFNL
ncbi:PilW family protein [Dyella acidiphila]|uniref:Prepilin-type N-terminal cleavage/methylation domain-containing protein n=1 Tax=Dyella acidiphila TaxID=2775866 RepID=A0ABR9GCT9_9GAMM|nr:prepilin-type N-terminal cleavage/methylation domain-containing protein [Dyella acidiphila]MBE1161861.1 prepilin-type N-terminal cleavage/methylation domain-containing protein [Dyella acidiphila]